MAFGGGGPHLCLGLHVARIEIAEMLRELLTRLPGPRAGRPPRAVGVELHQRRAHDAGAVHPRNPYRPDLRAATYSRSRAGDAVVGRRHHGHRIETSNFVLPSATAMPEWSVPAFAPSVEHTWVAARALVVRTPTSTLVVDPWLIETGRATFLLRKLMP